jgi:membrane associated rhomboid family serine protease
MGWQDREYGNGPYADADAGVWSRVRRPTGVTLGLMIGHVAALLLATLLRRDLAGAAESLTWIVTSPLGILLHPYLTSKLLTGVFVVLALWSLGGRLEARIGHGRLLTVYLLGNLLAGSVYWALVHAAPPLAAAPLEYPVGALAAFCLLAWRVLRHDAVAVFGRTTSTAMVYAISAAIVITLQLLTERQGAVAWVLAAGGGTAAVGLVQGLAHVIGAARQRRPRVHPSIPRAPRPAPTAEPELDDLLAKISRGGLDSLTPAEHERLEAARRRLLRREH